MLTQEDIDKMSDALRAQGLTWNQTNFAVSLVRNFIDAEREACAMVCEAEAQRWRDSDAEGSESLAYEDKALESAARAIRMRSNLNSPIDSVG